MASENQWPAATVSRRYMLINSQGCVFDTAAFRVPVDVAFPESVRIWAAGRSGDYRCLMVGAPYAVLRCDDTGDETIFEVMRLDRRALITSTCAAIMYDDMLAMHLPAPVADRYRDVSAATLLAGAVIFAPGKMADWCAHIARLAAEQIADKVIAGEMSESDAYDYAREDRL